MSKSKSSVGLALPEFRKHLGSAQTQYPGHPDVRAKQPDSEYRTVGILGAGTAGYLTALAMRKFRPDLNVTIISSSKIPVIGVGESTTSEMPPFLHGLLGLDILEFYKSVKPTWKLGIRFEWGAPEPYYFNYPFDDGRPLEGHVYDGHTLNVSLLSVLMTKQKGLVAKLRDGVHVALLGVNPYAYHLDNQRFVRFLGAQCAKRKVAHLDRVIKDAEVSSDGENITALITDDNERLEFDLYVDCSGFRSTLLGEKLGSKFKSFQDSLYTDRAIIAETPHGGTIKPYTTATTMNAGWCWNIPQVDEDHLGYVFSSSHCEEDQAYQEMKTIYPDATEYRVVKFRSGRHEEFFKGNVVAIGNSYGFVEPLEATALQVIISEVCLLLRNFPTYKSERITKKLLNDEVAGLWDYIRWFLSVHYRFNRRKETEFWRECQEKVDISGAEEIIGLFKENAPLVYRDLGMASGRHLSGRVFNNFGFDMLLFGQNVDCNAQPPRETRRDYKRRVASYTAVADTLMSQAEGLKILVDRQPDALIQHVRDKTSWFAQFADSMY